MKERGYSIETRIAIAGNYYCIKTDKQKTFGCFLTEEKAARFWWKQRLKHEAKLMGFNTTEQLHAFLHVKEKMPELSDVEIQLIADAIKLLEAYLERPDV